MKGFPATHIIYFEDTTNPAKVIRKLINRYHTLQAAKNAFDLLYKENRKADAYIEGNELRIKEKNRVIKRWIIASVQKEKELNLG